MFIRNFETITHTGASRALTCLLAYFSSKRIRFGTNCTNEFGKVLRGDRSTKTRNALAALLLTTALAGCNTSSSAVEGLEDAKQAAKAEQKQTDELNETASKPTEKPDEKSKEKPQETAKVIRKAGSTSKRGTHIKALVNNVPVTNYDIDRRAAFLRLRRVSGNRTQIAQDEMIEQALKMSEARARGTVASNEQVDAAFANFAKSNRISTSRMATELGRMGITAKHFKGFIRTQISWNRTVTRRFSADTRQKSQQEAIFELKQAGSDKPETTEYSIKQIVFVVPENKRKSIMGARRKEANSFRQRLTSCDQAITLAKELRDVAIIDRGRVMEPELPPNWTEDILKTEVGKTTRPLTTSKGIELMAVCSKRNVSDDRAAQILSQSKDFQDFNKKGAEAGAKYLKELREKAIIIYR